MIFDKMIPVKVAQFLKEIDKQSAKPVK
jgi:hypothetical protein